MKSIKVVIPVQEFQGSWKTVEKEITGFTSRRAAVAWAREFNRIGQKAVGDGPARVEESEIPRAHEVWLSIRANVRPHLVVEA